MRKIAVLFAVGRADQFVQVFPPAALVFLSFDRGLFGLHPLFGNRVLVQFVLETGNRIPHLFQGLLLLFESRFKRFQRLVGELKGQLLGQMRLPILLSRF